MPPARRVRRAPLGAFLGVLATLAVVGCADAAPLPQPTPSATGFTSDDEAFAAAEATYRAYVDALNAVDLSDPATFEPVYALTTGDALAGEKRSLTRMSSDGLTVSGAARVAKFFGQHAEHERVQALACYDVAEVSVLDRAGVSQVRPDRAPVIALQLEFERRGTKLLIASSTASEDPACDG